MYSGFIQIEGGAEKLHVSYLGLAASLISRAVLDNTTAFFGFQLPAILNPSGQVQTGSANYTFTGGDVPKIIFRWVPQCIIVALLSDEDHLQLSLWDSFASN